MTNPTVRRVSRWSRPRVRLLLPLLASAALAPACGPEFSSCEAHRSCPPAVGGQGGNGGADNSSAGGRGSSGSGGAAGIGGGSSDAGGAGAGGLDTGGSDASGASAGGASIGSAGSAGAGGEAGQSEPCADEGAVECPNAASAIVRTCTNGLWIAESCEDGSLCDSSAPACKPVIAGCAARRAGDAFCEGIETRHVCGPDLVTTTEQICSGACVEGACRKPTCGDGKLSSGESCDDANLVAGDGCSATCRAEPVAIELGYSFGCALLSDQRLKCWGENGLGELGLGDVLARGDAPNELGTSLRETLTDVSAFAVGSRHACAVSRSETWCWGDNSKYALGTGAVSPPSSRAPVKVALGAKPVALAAGEDFTCALLADHSLRCWGSNTGQVFGVGAAYLPTAPQAVLPLITLGSATDTITAGLSLCAQAASGLLCSGSRFPSAAYPLTFGTDFVPAGISSGFSNDCAWSAGGAVKCWGSLAMLGLDGQGASANALAAAPRVPLTRAVSTLDVGVGSTCAVLDNGDVECWGSTSSGALGRPDLYMTLGVYLGDAAGEMAKLRPLDLGANGLAKAVSVGQAFACALLQRGVIKCWGSNANGQLGHGTTETRGDDLGEMGDALPETQLD